MAFEQQATAEAGGIAVNIIGDHNVVTIYRGDAELRLTRFHRMAQPIEKDIDLLLPANAAIPMVGRDRLLSELSKWGAGDKPVAVRLITGSAGAGKTRLAIELCRQFESVEGNIAGFVTTDELVRFVESNQVERWDSDRPTLMVVDYAAAKARLLARWMAALTRRPATASGRLRLLFLERHGSRESGWWRDITSLGARESRQIERLLVPAEPLQLPIIDDGEKRRAIIASVMRRSSKLHELNPPLQPPVAGRDAAFDARLADLAQDQSALYLHMAAVVAVQARRTSMLEKDRRELANYLAGSERNRLDKLAVDRGLDSCRYLNDATAITVQGGVNVEDLALLIENEAQALGEPAKIVDCRKGLVAGLGRHQSPGADAIGPDLIGEAFVLEHFRASEAPLTEQCALIERCFRRAAKGTLESSVRAAQDFADPSNEADVPVAWLRHLLQLDDSAEHLQAIALALPQQTTALRAFALTVHERLVVALGREDADPLRVALAAGNLAIRQSALGQFEKAEASQAQVVQLARALSEDQPEHFESLLARALNNLSGSQSNLGRCEDALTASSEAVEIYRKLATDRPDAFLPDLAMSLSNFSKDLSNLGRREDALQASSEAVEIYRKLAADRPDAFLPDLAISLNNLSAFQNNLGRREDALQASSEAVEIYRKLADDRPDAFLPDLATSCGSHGSVLKADGQWEAAARSFEEGVHALAGHFKALPQASGQTMASLCRDYVEACEKSEQQPNMELLAPVLEVFQRLQDEGEERT